MLLIMKSFILISVLIISLLGKTSAKRDRNVFKEIAKVIEGFQKLIRSLKVETDEVDVSDVKSLTQFAKKEGFYNGSMESSMEQVAEEISEALGDEVPYEVKDGDILINPDADEDNDRKRNLNRYGRWPGDTIYYEISDDFMGNDTTSQRQRATIIRALNEISNVSCAKFVERTTEIYWVKFMKSASCSSYIGRVSRSLQPQPINLHPFCIARYGTVLHEILHAMGFAHEQSRPDRDNFVEILYENIKDGTSRNFQISSGSITLERDYDYGSVMHYGKTAFSKNNKDTIEPIEDGYANEMGQRKGMSTGDIIDINLLYNCKGKTNYVGEWSEFDPCNGLCKKSRQRFCGDETKCPGINDDGVVKEVSNCTEDECHRVIFGHWGHWSEMLCKESCGPAVTTKIRVCNNPKPLNTENSCEGPSSVNITCKYIPHCDASCGGSFYIENGSQSIFSPNYPLAYPSDQNCVYNIYVESGSYVKMSFSSFALEAGTEVGCRYDSVKIYDGTQQDSTMATLCGENLQTNTYVSTGPVMTIVFKSDESGSAKGFEALVEITTSLPSVPSSMVGSVGSLLSMITSRSLSLQVDLSCLFLCLSFFLSIY